MGLFERLGEKVERVKQEVDSARTGSANYRCRACGTLIYSDLEACPECGSDDLEPNESTSEGSDESTSEGPDGSTTAEPDEPAAESVESPSGTSDGSVESPTEGSDDVPADEPVESLIEDAEELSKEEGEEEAAGPATEE